MTDFSPREILRVLVEHEVDFVLIGGYALEVLAYPVPRTQDVDITPSRSPKNLDRLASALRALDARLRAHGLGDEGLQIPLDRDTFTHVIAITFRTRFGQLDICLIPDGTQGFDDLSRTATVLSVDGVEVSVASIADIVRSKQAAGRPKDRQHLNVILQERDED